MNRPTRRTRPRTPLALVAAALVPSCLSPAPGPEQWQAIGFRTPEQTFHTFRTAFATDQLDLEYRCLSDAFRAREGLDGFGYRILRDRLEEQVPGLAYLARAEVQGRVDLGDVRVGLVARVAVAWVERWFLVELVREEYFEVWRGDTRVLDGYTDFDQAVVVDARPEATWLWASVRWEDPLGGDAAPDPAELDQVVVGREWKLDGLTPLGPEEARALLDRGTPAADVASALPTPASTGR